MLLLELYGTKLSKDFTRQEWASPILNWRDKKVTTRDADKEKKGPKQKAKNR